MDKRVSLVLEDYPDHQDLQEWMDFQVLWERREIVASTD
jgi:hypothetical protein